LKRKVTIPKKAKTHTPPETEFCEHEWLKLKPKGLVFEGTHFVFILENLEKNAFLPLRFPVLTADLLGLPGRKSLWKKSLGNLSGQILKEWDVHLQRCVFVKQALGRHRVRLYYKKDGTEQFLEQDLENVLGFSLEARLPFYATRAYIHDSQVGTSTHENFIINQKWTDGRQRYLM